MVKVCSYDCQVEWDNYDDCDRQYSMDSRSPTENALVEYDGDYGPVAGVIRRVAVTPDTLQREMQIEETFFIYENDTMVFNWGYAVLPHLNDYFCVVV